jgi:hypothetical protein
MLAGGGTVGILTNLMAKVMIKLLWKLLTVAFMKSGGLRIPCGE